MPLPPAAPLLDEGLFPPPRRCETMIGSPSLTPSVISRFLPSDSPITTCCATGFPWTSFQIVTFDPGAPATGKAEGAPPEVCTIPGAEAATPGTKAATRRRRCCSMNIKGLEWDFKQAECLYLEEEGNKFGARWAARKTEINGIHRRTEPLQDKRHNVVVQVVSHHSIKMKTWRLYEM